MPPLQDADELGIAMESEKALLEQWRTYRVETLTAPDISWPGKPKQKHPRYSGDYQENFRGGKA
ncbi:hypothetical protein C1N58_00185 [Pantoea sp. SGAir0180]|uniref:tail fiber assembly protein n=2 Tax=Pantoea stewartii TaxID=66269 RepID=UPI00092FC380|nr:tail fiber assembly protein [Pantoea stewartii]QIE99428.1 tail fiber assembly protein [Pantoea stewartii]